MRPYYQESGVTIYHADCRDVLAQLAPVDLLLTDIPYGIGLGIDKDMRAAGHGLAKRPYASYEDSYENYRSIVVPRLQSAIAQAKRAAVFCGPHLQELPKADAIGGVYCPAGSGRHPWGFKTFLPVLFYGTAPELNKGAQPNTLQSSATAEQNGHPCPKPLEWLLWLVRIGSREGDSILDPFAGSGTTAVAAKKLGRRCIAIEIEEKYCEITARRVQEAALPLLEMAEQPRQFGLDMAASNDKRGIMIAAQQD